MSVAGQSSQVVFFRAMFVIIAYIFNLLRNHENSCDQDRGGIGKNAKVNEGRCPPPPFPQGPSDPFVRRSAFIE